MDREKIKSRLLAKREIDAATGCWVYTGSWDAKGYGIIHFRKPRGVVKVHRLAQKIWNRGPSNYVCHTHSSCPHCCFNPEHLGGFRSLAAAMKFARLVRRWGLGENNGRAILDDGTVRAILQMKGDGMKIKEILAWLAEQGVAAKYRQVQKVCCRETFRSVTA